jgi:Uma2 family endonuclease
MGLHKTNWTPVDFELWAETQTGDEVIELIAGDIVVSPSNLYSSHIASQINYFLVAYLRENPIGFVTGESGGYRVGSDRYAPDVAFLSKQRQPELTTTGYNPIAPDLAVEVVSPTDVERNIRIKTVNYLNAGTTVWVVYPEAKEVEIYQPNHEPVVLTAEGVITAEHILPGFSLPVREIFPE